MISRLRFGLRVRSSAAGAHGFTLVELLVTVVILGIIMAAIGAMITTAFRTTTIVSSRLNASRAPKLVSTYWIPDVGGAEVIKRDVGGCGDAAGDTPLVTFEWSRYPSAVGTEAPDAAAPPTPGSATWAIVTRGTRTQVVRRECGRAGPIRTATVVPDLGADSVRLDAAGTAITVSVPDRTEPNEQFTFVVDGTQAVTPS